MLWLVAGLILAVNLPFGFWRAGTRRFSLAWFLAVHAPVPIAMALRGASGLDLQLSTLPLFVAAYFGGQLVGGWLRRDPGAEKSTD